MEIKIFLRLVLKKWRLMLITVFVTVGSTLIFTLVQTPIYSATASYVVSPSSRILNGTNFLSGLSVLGGQPTVSNTYSSIATSSAVRQNASKALGLDLSQTNGLDVESRVKSGTNIIEITVKGTDPVIVQAFANRVGQSTVEYVSTLYEVYDMKSLDGAKSPVSPVWPNTKLNLALGLVFGLGLGVFLAIMTGLNEL